MDLVKVNTLILLRDARECDYMSNEDCPLARAINRRLKKKYRASVGAEYFAIYDGGKAYEGKRVYQSSGNSIDSTRWNSEVMANMTRNKFFPVEIPAQFLKKQRASRAKVDATDNRSFAQKILGGLVNFLCDY